MSDKNAYIVNLSHKIGAKFEKISNYQNDDKLFLPVRKTHGAAGYDFMVAEDTIIPSYSSLMENLYMSYKGNILTTSEISQITKDTKCKPTLVPTGIKCKIPNGYYLELSVRSSTPLKNWIILANGVGIIDQDYYNNESNEGHIFFQLINLSPFPILLKKGEYIGQGIIKKYEITDDDSTFQSREGGFGSTS